MWTLLAAHFYFDDETKHREQQQRRKLLLASLLHSEILFSYEGGLVMLLLSFHFKHWVISVMEIREYDDLWWLQCRRNVLKCLITSLPPSSYAGTAQKVAEMLDNKTVIEVILIFFSYFSAFFFFFFSLLFCWAVWEIPHCPYHGGDFTGTSEREEEV